MVGQEGRNVKTGALVVTYNRKDLLAECIGAIQKQTIEELDIFIVDNASNDGTGEFVKKLQLEDSKIKYFNTGKNIGGAGGFSYGIKLLIKLSYDRIWLMDDDTIPESDALEELLKVDAVLGGKYGFLVSSVRWTNGDCCIMNRPLIDEEWMENLSYIKHGILPVKRATFVSMMLTKNVVEEFGLPIKEFFIWGDDQEFTDRISRRMSGYFVSDSRVIHKMKKNVGSDISNDVSERIERYEYAFRNELYLARRSGVQSILFYIYRVMGTIRAVMRSSVKQKPKRIKTILKGVAKGILFKPNIEYVKNYNEDNADELG